MTLTEWASLGELVGGIGVIASLLYLAAQIRQSSTIAKSSTTSILLGNSIQINNVAAGDISSVFAKARRGEALDDEEEYRYFSYMLVLFAQSWQVHFQHERGMLDEEVFAAYEPRMFDYLSRLTVREFWSENAFRFGESFQADLERAIERANADGEARP